MSSLEWSIIYPGDSPSAGSENAMVKTLGKTLEKTMSVPQMWEDLEGSFFGVAPPRLLPFEENSGLVTSVSGELGCQKPKKSPIS